MADSPVLYVYYRPDNDDAYPGVPARHITEADWARFSPSQRRIVQEATTQDGYGRRKVWVHIDLVDETEQERAEREAREQAARDAYERGQSIVRWRDFEPLVPGPGEVIVGSEDGPVSVPAGIVGGGEANLSTALADGTVFFDRFRDTTDKPTPQHSPDIGGSWVAWIQSTKIVPSGLVANVGTADVVQPGVGTDLDITATITLGEGVDGGVGVIFRGGAITDYWYVWFDCGDDTFRLYSVIDGTRQVRVTQPVTVTRGQRYALHIRVYGSTVVADFAGYRVQWHGVTQTGTGVGIRIRNSTGPVTNSVQQIMATVLTPEKQTSLPPLPTISGATNASSPITLPVVHGTEGQGTHPDVIDAGVQGWKGYRYWMVWTPYTDGNIAFENPSIVASNNGTTWVTPAGLTNPIIPAPVTSGHYNNDPDIVLHNGTMYLMYRVAAGTVMHLWVTESTDGRTWSSPEKVYEQTGLASGLSPALAVRNGTWYMWVVSGYHPVHRGMELRTAPSPYGPWSAPTICVANVPADRDMWHLNVYDRGSRFDAIISDSTLGAGAGADGNLVFATSYDGIHWNYAQTPFLTHRASGEGWDDDKLYRTAMVRTATGYDLWYSARGTNGKWWIAKTAITVR